MPHSLFAAPLLDKSGDMHCTLFVVSKSYEKSKTNNVIVSVLSGSMCLKEGKLSNKGGETIFCGGLIHGSSEYLEQQDCEYGVKTNHSVCSR